MMSFIHNNILKFAIFFTCLFISASIYGATITSAGTGNWGTAATWSPAQVPTINDDVIIANGHTVTINANGQACKTMTVNTGGILRFSESQSTWIFTINGDFTINGTFTQNNTKGWPVDVFGDFRINSGGIYSTSNQNTANSYINMRGAGKKIQVNGTVNVGSNQNVFVHLRINLPNTTDVLTLESDIYFSNVNNTSPNNTLYLTQGILNANGKQIHFQKFGVINATANGKFAWLDSGCEYTEAGLPSIYFDQPTSGSDLTVTGTIYIKDFIIGSGKNNFYFPKNSSATVYVFGQLQRTNTNENMGSGTFVWGPNSNYIGPVTTGGTVPNPSTAIATGPAQIASVVNAAYVTPTAIQTAIDACSSTLDKPMPMVSNPTCNSLQISWAPISGANSYNLYTVSSASANDTVLVQAGVTSPFTHTSLASGTTYYYKVKAIASPTDARLSDAISGTTTSLPTPTLNGTPGYTQVALTFSAPVTATDFTVYRCTSPTTGCTSLTTSGTSFIDTGLSEGTTYYYKIVANFAGGCSSEVVKPITTLGNLCPPTGLFSISKICDPIVVNGYCDTIATEKVWKVAPWQKVDGTKAATLSSVSDCQKPVEFHVSGKVAQWRALHNGTNVYFFVRIYDDNPRSAGAPVWAQDGVEIYIGRGTTALQFGFGWTGDGMAANQYYTNGTGATSMIRKYATFWDLEVSIPIAANSLNFTGSSIQMELSINQARDGETCRSAQISTWTASADHWSNVSGYHTTPLSECTALTATDETVCNGTSTILMTQLSTVNGGLNYSWEQSINGGTTWTAATTVNPADATDGNNNITVAPAVQTMYRAVYDGVNSCTLTIAVHPCPTISGTLNICVGNTTTLTGSATPHATTPWTSDTPSVATITGGGLVTGISAGTSTITYMNTNGCTQTATVNVNTESAVSISIAPNPGTTICSGTSVTFTATPTNGGTTPAYQWKLNGGNVGTNSATYTNSSLANADKVRCVLTSNISCPTGNPATSNEITMTVNPSPSTSTIYHD